MIFNALKLRNYGIFREANFDLRPTRGPDGEQRNIVLFGGMNGSGKTTILEAVRLCLYGKRSRGLRVRTKDYKQFLKARIHRARKGAPSPTVASVVLEFEHIHAGEKRRFNVERKWRDTGRGVEEHLSLICDGHEDLEFSQKHWEEFLTELVPPGLSQLFFFDGEKIQALADDEAGDYELANSIKALLGLDLTDRLQADLAVYLRRQHEHSDGTADSDQLVQLQEQLDAITQQTRKLHQERAQLEARLGNIEKRIRDTEGKISAEGGSFARLREELLARRAAAEAIRFEVEDQIRSLAAQLLPFALIPDRCRALGGSLRDGLAQQDREAATRYLESRICEVSGIVAKLAAPGDNGLRRRIRSTLRAQLLPRQEPRLSSHPIGHDVVRQLLRGIEIATEELPLAVPRLADKLAGVSRDLALVERNLNRAPTDHILQPLLSQLADLHKERTELHAAGDELEEAVRSSGAEERLLQHKIERQRYQLSEARSTEARTRLTVKVQKAVSDFAIALRNQKINELRRHFHRCFGILSRKDDLIQDVEIAPDTFKVTFSDNAGRALDKAELSAGEKQIYAIAMLWGLALTSRRPLPFLIDTPLGRLDSDHRANLVREYFPFVSHQVVILSTDTEIDEVYFRKLLPHLARAYHLRFDEAAGETCIMDSYFWMTEHYGCSEKVDSPAA